jgi:anti-anti-sigma factor
MSAQDDGHAPDTDVDIGAEPNVLRLTGEIDLANVAEHRARILAEGSERLLVLDLDAVEYVDSAAIGLLDEVVSVFAANGWPLRVVCAPSAICRRVLEIGAPALVLHDTVA